MSLPGRLLRCLLLLPLLACGGSAPGGDGPRIESFSASPAELRVGDPVELVPRFSGRPARIEPDVGPVSSGTRYPVGPFASGRTFTLVVGEGAEEVRAELRLPLVYRHRLRPLTPSDNARVDHGATVLSDGRVLVFGGRSPSYTPWVVTEIFDPATRAFTTTGEMPVKRSSPVWTGVSGSRIVVAGGETSAARRDEATAVLVSSPQTSSWTSPGNLLEVRAGNSATRLPLEGSVLLVAGGDFYLRDPASVTPVELFDVDHGTTRAPAGEMVESRFMHTATLRFDGRVLLAGGLNAFTSQEVSSAELYDAATETFTRACTLVSERWAHAAVSLPDGRVLLAGGYFMGRVTGSAELWDPATGKCTATGNLHAPRADLRLVPLASGEVLALGGRNDDGLALTAVETWNPETGAWTERSSLPVARVGHTASLLPSGQVLLLGGADGSGAWPMKAAELYD
ncbi:MAG TPA: kelch repeat-containing protein [Myxococcaceae bacterium]